MARAAQWKTVRGPTGAVSNLLKDLFGVELAYMERAQSAWRAADGLQCGVSKFCHKVVLVVMGGTSSNSGLNRSVDELQHGVWFESARRK